MAAPFAGKVALVTGGGSGIGRNTALAFAREGAAVVVTGRTADTIEQTVKLIESEGGTASAVVADVSVPEDVAHVVATVAERHGALDIAFNNAGTFTAGNLAEVPDEEFARVLATNLTSVFLSMKHEIGFMREHGGGVIVNNASNLGHVTIPGLGAYSASKAAVSQLTRSAAKEYIADGIRINAVSPGPIDTPLWPLLPGETEAERADRMANGLPLGRAGTLDEATSAVLWLAASESGFAVGHDLVIDGGVSA
ncbi:SDR family NAD(P)-dependent oxidoreductase [Streptomyces sp. NPDC048248]|uniref:SDR family NAD(P)-dependent oxidoreductase n=1 Tax=Streptomyces sp. NPDC048248 TaxID=3365523 RepID=UPI0037202EEE